ncbi:MAG: STM3941 family protein [Bacteroidota bacterium]|jgi:hypothetical protein
MKDVRRFKSNFFRNLMALVMIMLLGGFVYALKYHLLPALGYRPGYITTPILWIAMGVAVLGVFVIIYRIIINRNIYLELNTSGIICKLYLTHTIEIPWKEITGFEIKQDFFQKLIIVHLRNGDDFIEAYKRDTGKNIPNLALYQGIDSSRFTLPLQVLGAASTLILDELNNYWKRYGNH